MCAVVMWNKSNYGFSMIAIFVDLCAMLVAVVQPYKSVVYNTVETILISFLSLLMTTGSAYLIAAYIDPTKSNFNLVLMNSFALVLLFYILGYFGVQTLLVKKLPQKLLLKMCGLAFKLYRRLKDN